MQPGVERGASRMIRALCVVTYAVVLAAEVLGDKFLYTAGVAGDARPADTTTRL